MDPNIRIMLIAEEGYAFKAYPDQDGIWTIGVGHARVTPGLVWTQAQIESQLVTDVNTAQRALTPWMLKLPAPVIGACTGMAFQMGAKGFLSFHDTLAALQHAQYAQAASDMMQSEWAKETPARAVRMATMIRTVAWLPWHAQEAALILKEAGISDAS